MGTSLIPQDRYLEGQRVAVRLKESFVLMASAIEEGESATMNNLRRSVSERGICGAEVAKVDVLIRAGTCLA